MQPRPSPNPIVKERALMRRMDNQAHASQAPTMKACKEHAEVMKKAVLSRVNCKFGKKWSTPFRHKHKDFVARKP